MPSRVAKPSLQTQYLVYVALMVTVVTGVVATVALINQNQQLIHGSVVKGRVLVNTLEISCVNAFVHGELGLGDPEPLLEDYLMEVMAKETLDAVYAMVLDARGRVIAHNDLMQYGRLYDDSIARAALSSRETRVQRYYHSELGTDVMDVSTPLAIAGKRWGTLRVGLSLDEVKKAQGLLLRKILFIAGIILLLSFVSTLFLARRFIRPVTDLAGIMEATGGDELNVKVPVDRSDEIGVLAQSFNTMIDRIRGSNQQLAEAREKLFQSEKLAAIGKTAAGVAHEINNPLGGMFLGLDTLKKQGDDPETRERYLLLLEKGLKRIEHVVQQLMGFAREYHFEEVPCDVHGLLEETLGFLEDLFQRSNIRVNRQFTSSPMNCTVDPQYLQQVFVNLTLNAVHAMRSGGTLTIGTEAGTDSRRVTFTDTGVGIPQENLPRIFDPFFTTRKTGEGTGLGLSVSYGIISKMGGELSVTSREGGGRRVYCFFPISDPQEAGLMTALYRVLLIEDDELMRITASDALTSRGWAVEVASNGETGLKLFRDKDFDLVISDIRLPDLSGIEILKEIKGQGTDTEVLLITGYGSVEHAVEAMKMGASDYMTKPFTRDAFLIRVEKLLSNQALRRDYEVLKEETGKQGGYENIIGNSPAMERLFKVMKRVSATDSNVLIIGESGTGKELVARAIHYGGPRREAPLIAVHCAALSQGLLESELFGHEKGAFTGAVRSRKGRFELAQNGTLFLDEVGEIPASVQVRLLRVLQEREFERVGGEESIQANVRILSATQVEMEKAIESGKFREDLYYRLCVVPVRVPPLRERREDIPLLMDHFLSLYGKKMKRKAGIVKEAKALLLEYDYPGNVRELEGIIERGMNLASGKLIQAEDLPRKIRKGTTARQRESRTLREAVREAEAAHILDVLGKTGWNKTRAAQLLGISRKNLWEKLQQLEISEDHER